MPQLSAVSEPWWDDKPLAIVGTGPSLTGVDFSAFDIPGVRVLAVKEAIWDLPCAEAVFSLDRPWINRQADKLRALRAGRYFAVENEHGPCADIAGAIYIQRARFEGLSDDPAIIQTGGNSGFGAVNLAYLKRAKQIVLFGFDYREDGHAHHHKPDQYWWYRDGQNARYWENWGSNFRACLPQLKAAGVTIINASPESTVDALPKCSVAEGVEYLHRLRSAGDGSLRGSAEFAMASPDATVASARAAAV